MLRAEPLPATGDRVQTADGGALVLGERLGLGGQGVVYKVQGAAQCVKIYFGLDEARAGALRRRLERLRLLQADETLVLPRKLLCAPLAGHVMDLVEDADPLSTLAVGQAPPKQHYGETGGLRRRLLAGVRLAWAFQALHARGLAYCDLSFENVFVTRRGVPEIRLIDCDNLTIQGAPPPTVAGTPWFIAPEVLDGRMAPDPLTDAHSLAVLLYHLLVQTHPLRGDAVQAASPEAEQVALRGRWPLGDGQEPLPWIDHPDDDRNRTRTGIRRDLVLSARLQETFHLAMGPGLLDRRRRPSEGRWAEVLSGAVDGVRSCAACGHQSYYRPRQPCAWCGAPLPGVLMLLIDQPGGRRPVVVEQRRHLFPRHLQFRQNLPHEAPIASVTAQEAGLVVENLGEATLLVLRDGRPTRQERVGQGQRVRLAPMDRLQIEGQHPVAQLVQG